MGEETLAERVSADVVRRIVTENKPIRNWLETFTSGAKQKLGKASDDDLVRILSNKLLNDPSLMRLQCED